MDAVAIVIILLSGLVVVISIFSFFIGLVHLTVSGTVKDGKSLLKKSAIAFAIALIILIISIAVISNS